MSGVDGSRSPTGAEEIAALEREWRHACGVALASIGQADRAANVAWRDELAAKLRTAKAQEATP